MPHDDDEHKRHRSIHLRVDAIHVHVHHVADDPVMAALSQLLSNQRKIMATLADLQAAVTAEDTAVDAAIVLLNGLAQQIKDLQPNQAAIDALAADVSAKTAALAKAVTDNTPTPPATPTVPVAPPA